MKWRAGRGIVAVGAVVLGLGVWWGVVRDTPGSDSAAPSRAAVPGDTLDLVPGCRRDTCDVVARRDGVQFPGGRATVLVVSGPRACGRRLQSSVHALRRGRIVWSGPREAVCGDPVGGIEVDATGHAFLLFPHGDDATRLVVLGTRAGEVVDYGSFDGRFTAAAVSVEDGDGDRAFEITVSGEGCRPCEGAPVVILRWDGSDYAVAD
jgi:hypothetical protein